ncbi:MAG: prepilin-type N-terminal cleavage/methylation domain-containing protein [Lachnospiraceae bacterium]|nr:prepilin-type N-terminal cleavage/methylation domain-containing protein [Lachnospiraceae bacterium]
MNSTRGEKKNGGFSLVEMIVVLAIMAVLVGVLAPAYLRYIEKSRKQRDDTAAEELKHAAEIVVFSGEYAISTGTVLVTFDKANGITVQNDPLGNALSQSLTELFGTLSDVKPESKTYATKTYKITIVATVEGYPSLSGAWY